MMERGGGWGFGAHPWFPSHLDVEGNHHVDELADQACTRSPIMTYQTGQGRCRSGRKWDW